MRHRQHLAFPRASVVGPPAGPLSSTVTGPRPPGPGPINRKHRLLTGSQANHKGPQIRWSRVRLDCPQPRFLIPPRAACNLGHVPAPPCTLGGSGPQCFAMVGQDRQEKRLDATATLNTEWTWPYRRPQSPKMNGPRSHVFRSTPALVTEPRKPSLSCLTEHGVRAWWCPTEEGTTSNTTSQTPRRAERQNGKERHTISAQLPVHMGATAHCHPHGARFLKSSLFWSFSPRPLFCTS